MAITYVDSNATGGSNDGSSWANAYLRLASAAGVGAGAEIWIASDHEEGATSSLTITFTNGTASQPIRLLSVNKATNTYAAGALINNTGDLSLQNSITVWGVTFLSGTYINLQGTGHVQTFFGCTFQCTNDNYGYGAINRIGASAYVGVAVRLIECTLTAGTGAGGWIALFHTASRLYLSKCTFSGGANKTSLIAGGWVGIFPSWGSLFVEDMDLSALTKISTTGTGQSCHIKRCKINASLEPSSANDLFAEKLIENCDDGTITAPPLGLNWYRTLFGDVKSVSAVYRSSGASDGETGYSWQMVAASTCLEASGNAISTPPITRWVSGGSEIDITVFVASEITLNDDDVWIEVSGPNNTASPNQTAQGYSYSSRPASPLATPAALTTDSTSTWNGTGVSIRQKITHTYTPTEAGPVTIRCFLAKPSTTVYVDPKIEVS